MIEIGYLADGVQAKTAILLMAEGSVKLAGAEPVIMDKDAGEKVIAAFNEQGVKVPIDFEHSTVFKASKGERSDAAGWVTSFEYVEGEGLMAHVEWTEEAGQLIAGKQYQYFSPVIHFDKESRRVERISSVALTNTPRMKNIDSLLAASAALLENDSMAEEKPKDEGTVVAMDTGGPLLDLAMALKDAGHEVPEGVSMEELLAMAIAAIKGGGSDESAEEAPAEEAMSTATLSALGVATDEEGVLMATQLKEKADQVAILSQQVEELKKVEQDRTINAKMDEYIKANKLNPNNEGQISAARKFAARDFEGWVEFMEAQDAIVASGRVVTGETKRDDRASVIEAAKREYHENRGKLSGIELASWVDQSLREKELVLLSSSEKGDLN
jgi:phage I-like protein